MNTRQTKSGVPVRIAVFCLSLLVSTVRAEQPEEHIHAYVFGLRAEQAEAAGKPEEAIELYNESLRLYRETASNHPGWNTAAVQHRINTTGNEIERLRQLILVNEENKRNAALATHKEEVDRLVREERSSWLAERKALEERIAELESTLHDEIQAAGEKQASLDEALAKADQSASLAATRAREVEQVREALAAGEQRIVLLEQSAAEREQALAASRDLARVLAEKEASLQQMAAELSGWKQREQDLLATLEERTKETERLKKLAAAVEKVDALKEERGSLQQEVKDLGRRLQEMTRRLADAEASRDEHDAKRMSLETQVQEARQANEEARKDLERARREAAEADKAAASALEDTESIRRQVESARGETDRARAELAAAREEIDKLKRVPAGGEALREREARYERAEVENIVFRETMAAMSNRIQQLAAQQANAVDRLALEQKKWNTERSRLVKQVDALKETVDLNLEEVEKNRELRSRLKDLEKENRKLARRVSAEGEHVPDDVDRLNDRIVELEAELDILKGTQNP